MIAVSVRPADLDSADTHQLTRMDVDHFIFPPLARSLRVKEGHTLAPRTHTRQAHGTRALAAPRARRFMLGASAPQINWITTTLRTKHIAGPRRYHHVRKALSWHVALEMHTPHVSSPRGVRAARGLSSPPLHSLASRM